MPVVIREVISEIALGPEPPKESGGAVQASVMPSAEVMEQLVRQVTERVLERLRLEWEP
jgi:hypothetical protein